jgi:hypothetical protein
MPRPRSSRYSLDRLNMVHPTDAEELVLLTIESPVRWDDPKVLMPVYLPTFLEKFSSSVGLL